MPVETRPSDTFTKGSLLLGFSVVEFSPSLSGGGFGPAVQLGILGGEELQKEVTLLQLKRGDAGALTVDREVVSELEVSFSLELFNFRADIAQYIFGSTDGVAVTADAAAAGTTDLSLQASSAFDQFGQLDHANVSEASVEVTFQTITSEAVGTGDGATGGSQGDFALDQKIKVIGDVTAFLVGGVDEIAKLVAGSTPTANQIAIEVGEEDSIVTGSGAITFGSSETPAAAAAIVATYTPSFNTTSADIVNAGLPASLDNDFVLDPTLGSIRFLKEGADDSPFRLLGASAALNVAYTYNQRASVDLKPFTRNSVDGKVTIKHLTDIGINFVWTIPSATVIITDDALTFGAEEFGTATLKVNVNDAGGTDRFGTLAISTEAEAGA